MKKCSECNKAFENKDVFCDTCGATLRSFEIAKRPQTNSMKPASKVSKPHVFNRRQKKSRIKVWQMLLLIAAILLFASVFAVLIFGGQPSDATSALTEIKPILFNK